jgi:hypothetical protein
VAVALASRFVLSWRVVGLALAVLPRYGLLVGVKVTA